MPDSVVIPLKPVLILGASGFVGSRVVAALSDHPIYRPVAASRHSGLALDATDALALHAVLRDFDCVVNCIAGSNTAMIRSTQALCDVARTLPPRRIVHLSSMAVYGAATGTVHEDRAPTAPVSFYGQAKLECERIVRKFVDDGGDAVILRPTCIFGPGSPQWTNRLMGLLRTGRIGDLGAAGDGYCNLAFIDDLVAVIITALDAPLVSGQAFNVSSSIGLTWNEFFVKFGKALGAIPVRRISSRMLKIETKFLAPARRIAGMAIRSSMTEAITPSLAALWGQDIRIDCAAARQALRLRQSTVDEMIAAVLQSDPAPKALVRP